MRTDKKMPVLFQEEAECCGCAACANICPSGAIFMMPDDKGFLYPRIQAEKCICCGLCQKVCPLKEVQA